MEELTLTLAPPDPSAARRLLRQRHRGELLRIGHGVSTPSAAFRAASESAKHRARIEAVVGKSRCGLIVSHASAVVLHGLPWFGPLPDRVILTDPSRDRTQRLRFSDKVPARGRSVSTVEIDGITTTDLVTTAVDVALRSDRGHAIVVLDAVLRRGVRREELLAELDRRTTRRGAARARGLIELADPRIESAGESLTHLLLHDLGLPSPVLQHEFRMNSGLIARVDFWFPEQGVVVEFDGLVKYRDRAFGSDQLAEQAVIAEKIREDAVRTLPEVNAFVRLMWRGVLPGGEAPSRLRAAGLPVSSALRRTPPW